MPRSSMTKGLISQAEACRRLGVKVRALQQYVQRGEIECVRVPVQGKRTKPYFRPSEIERFLRVVGGAS